MKNEDQRRVDLLQTGALQNAIFNSANFSSIATDAQGVIQIFNVGAERMLGYSAAEVLDKITPADISDPQEIIARAEALSLELGTKIAPGFEALVFKASRGIEDIYELTYVRKDGSRLPAVVSVTALRDGHDAIIGYLLIATDNTSRKQASQYARSLLEASLDPLVAISPDGKITDVNEGSIKVTGVAREKLIGTDFSDYFTEPTKAREGYQQVFARGLVVDYPLTIRHQNGRLTDVLYNASVYKDPHGAVLGVFAAARDVTERKRAEAALLRAGALQRAIFNSANFSSIATDAKGVIQIFNVGAERMLGYSASEVMNKVTPADISDPQELIARAQALSLELGTRITPGFEALVFKASRAIEDIYELTYFRKDGSRFPAVVSVTALRDAAQAIIGYLLIGTDNTARKLVEAEQKRLDQALRETNLELRGAKVEAERANMAKSDFLSSMSHELRSPLNAILGFAQLIDSGSPLPTPGQKDSIDQILQAGWYLLDLINEILDLSLIESGKLSLSLEPVWLEEVLTDCQAMIDPQMRKSGIRVSFSHPESPLFVSADRTRVKQIVVNLLSNAIKYNRVGGSVEVTYRPRPGGSVRVSFQDTGEGLTADKLAQLFQPFNRLGQEGGVEEGTGIGLVVCKRLVELMGGSIGVESTVGFGSVFWIDLKEISASTVGRDSKSPTVAISTAIGSGPKIRTVLCVEDNPANLQLVAQILARRPDIRLLSAKDGRSGVEMALSTRPDVILMDINLPGISGVAALRILSGDPSTALIPVIALSANAMARDIEKGLKAGFFRYLTKPIKVGEFMDTLDLALELAKTRLHQSGSEVASP